MKRAGLAIVVIAAVWVASPVLGQDRVAPNIQAFSVQGTSVNLDYFDGKKNVLLVFYRTHD